MHGKYYFEVVVDITDEFEVDMNDLSIYIYALGVCTSGVGGNIRDRSPKSTQDLRLKSQIDSHPNVACLRYSSDANISTY